MKQFGDYRISDPAPKQQRRTESENDALEGLRVAEKTPPEPGEFPQRDRKGREADKHANGGSQGRNHDIARAKDVRSVALRLSYHINRAETPAPRSPAVPDIRRVR